MATNFGKLYKKAKEERECSTLAWAKLDIMFVEKKIPIFVFSIISIIIGILFGFYPCWQLAISFMLIQTILLIANYIITKRIEDQINTYVESLYVKIYELKNERN